MRAKGIAAGGRLFPFIFSWRASSRALSIISESMSASPDVPSSSTSPRFGREGFRPSFPQLGNALLTSNGLVEHPGSFPWVYVTVSWTSGGLLEGPESFSFSAANGLDYVVVVAFGSPAVDVRLVPRLDRSKRKF